MLDGLFCPPTMPYITAILLTSSTSSYITSSSISLACSPVLYIVFYFLTISELLSCWFPQPSRFNTHDFLHFGTHPFSPPSVNPPACLEPGYICPHKNYSQYLLVPKPLCSVFKFFAQRASFPDVCTYASSAPSWVVWGLKNYPQPGTLEYSTLPMELLLSAPAVLDAGF